MSIFFVSQSEHVDKTKLRYFIETIHIDATEISLVLYCLLFYSQCEKLKELIAKVRETLVNKDETDPEEIKKQTNELQQASLKLFEMAYKKVRGEERRFRGG